MDLVHPQYRKWIHQGLLMGFTGLDGFSFPFSSNMFVPSPKNRRPVPSGATTCGACSALHGRGAFGVGRGRKKRTVGI